MKKSTTAKKKRIVASETKKKQLRKRSVKQQLTIGIDIGDSSSQFCVLDESGEVVQRGPVATTRPGLRAVFGRLAKSRVALEVGTHSAWVSREFQAMGHEVIVANARKVRAITHNVRKNDRIDAEMLARLARTDVELLSPIQHRKEETQRDLSVIRARAALIEIRTAAINAARGLVKPFGERLKRCDADQVRPGLAAALPFEVASMVEPLLKAVAEITEQIGEYDQQIAAMEKRYPETMLLKQVYGVGPLIALTFVLTIEDPSRFAHSRDVGPYLGLVPKEHESGESKPELPISKAGDKLLRQLLVQGAQTILRKNAPDSDLQEWGLNKAESSKESSKKSSKQSSKKAKRRAVVGVARKLAVLLHRLWVTGEVYDPLYNRKAAERAKQRSKKAAA